MVERSGVMGIAILLNDKLSKEELAARFPHHQELLPLLKKLQML